MSETLPEISHPGVKSGELVDEYQRWQRLGNHFSTDLSTLPKHLLQTLHDISTWFKRDTWNNEGLMITAGSINNTNVTFLEVIFHTDQPTPTFLHRFLTTPRGPLGLFSPRTPKPALDLEQVFKPERYRTPMHRTPMHSFFDKGGIKGYGARSYLIGLKDSQVGPFFSYDRLKESTYPLYVYEVKAHPFGLYKSDDLRIIAASDPARVRIEVQLADSIGEWETFVTDNRSEWAERVEALERESRELQRRHRAVTKTLRQLAPEKFEAGEKEHLILLARLKDLPQPFQHLEYPQE